MAKKAKTKNAKKAKKARKATRTKVFTQQMILDDWKKAVKKGLGKFKNLDPAIAAAFETQLLAKIQQRLNEGRDYNVEGPNTRKVATFIGTVCKMMTPGNSVSLAVFEKVFDLGQIHPSCPGGGGSGQWCDI
jgi:hypothetical protein